MSSLGCVVRDGKLSTSHKPIQRPLVFLQGRVNLELIPAHFLLHGDEVARSSTGPGPPVPACISLPQLTCTSPEVGL